MAALFTVASWNVEHFKGREGRIGKIINQLGTINPDVFALYEVEGKEVFDELTKQFPGYSFHITEGPQIQEILVGVKSPITAFFTQKLEFKEGNKYLRPGALLSVNINNTVYSLLFLHTKSGSDPLGLGLRDDMFKKACKFRKTLDKAVGNQWGARYMFMGDLNTMGMQYPFDRGIDADIEIKNLAEKETQKVKMVMLAKDEPFTWSNGSSSRYKPANLDHVVVTDNISIKNNIVSVLGWPKQPNIADQDKWIKEHSDHGILFFEVLAS